MTWFSSRWPLHQLVQAYSHDGIRAEREVGGGGNVKLGKARVGVDLCWAAGEKGAKVSLPLSMKNGTSFFKLLPRLFKLG